MKRIFFFLSLCCVTVQIFAQNGSDILRYSLLQGGNGTARTMGVAGATGALGADFSALSNNPAGLAAYRTSEFVITPGYYSTNITSKLDGDAANIAAAESNAKFYLSNIGLIVGRRSSGKWTTKNFGIGLNNLANFDNGFFYEGKSKGSIVNRFQENANFNLANGGASNQFEEDLAIESGAVYKSNLIGNAYTSDFDGFNDAVISRNQEGNVQGKLRELVASYAANYKEKIMIGASVGVPFMSYYEDKNYAENDGESFDGSKPGAVPYFNYLNFRENLSQSAWGYNAKLGIIFIPTHKLRLGVAVHSPTVYKVTENFTTELSYKYIEKGKVNNNTANSPDGFFEYKMITPAKISGSAAYLFGKKGFVSADVDYVDYTQMKFQFDGDKADANRKNAAIQNTYKANLNVRLGAEFTADVFRFRAGFATLGFPTKAFDDRGYFDTATKIYSMGIGLRENRFYADLGYQIARSNTSEKPYLVSADYQQPSVARSRSASQIVATLGFKF